MPLSNTSVASLDLDGFVLSGMEERERKFQRYVGSAIGVVVLILLAVSVGSFVSTAYINITERYTSDKASQVFKD
jgi:hypothetical protein